MRDYVTTQAPPVGNAAHAEDDGEHILITLLAPQHGPISRARLTIAAACNLIEDLQAAVTMAERGPNQ